MGALVALVGITGFLVAVIAYYVLYVVGAWRVFEKTGEAGWKSIIPIYNGYIIYQKCWTTTMFWVTLILAIASSVLTGMNSESSMIGFIIGIIGIATAVISFIQNKKLAECFGKGIGFAIGLFFLNPIFMMILGFGSAEYNRNDF